MADTPHLECGFCNGSAGPSPVFGIKTFLKKVLTFVSDNDIINLKTLTATTYSIKVCIVSSNLTVGSSLCGQVVSQN